MIILTKKSSKFLSFNIFRIYTDSGRAQRPLFIVENSSLRIKKSDWEKMNDENDPNRMTFDDAVARGLIEFLDVEEEEVSMIAMNIDDLKQRSDYCYTYTHCEIHPSMILGVCASIIPFPDHNQVTTLNLTNLVST